ncbi:MAG: lipopolysaccharide assembly protein LapA domain-containing protein [Pseudomonadota bacterium]
MRFIYIVLGASLFILLLGLALKNTSLVVLHYYLGYAWQAPLSLMLLITLLLGIITGLVVCLPWVIKQRRELLAVKREIKTLKPNE